MATGRCGRAENTALLLLIKAFGELNRIRARDGAPPGVCPEYFSQLVDEIDACVAKRTGHTAWLHPWLYKDEHEIPS